MEFSRKEEQVLEVAAQTVTQELIQLTDIQLLSVGGGIADVTLS